jgi:hypothetical protein
MISLAATRHSEPTKHLVTLGTYGPHHYTCNPIHAEATSRSINTVLPKPSLGVIHKDNDQRHYNSDNRQKHGDIPGTP